MTVFLSDEKLRKAKKDIIELSEEIKYRRSRRTLYSLYPKHGPLRRELYAPHVKFFDAGKDKRERCIIAANRIGKSYGIGGYETSIHLTGLYPDWWTGKRFKTPVNWWAAGDTSQTVRDIAQEILVGPPHAHGTGLIPGDLISDIKRKQGIPDALEQVLVKHTSGGISRLVFKSYDQKRKSFQGTGQHGIWLDEECPMDIYGECLLRTMTTNGMVLLTFTPLMGLTEVVLNFMPSGKMPEGGSVKSKFIVNATWDDAPHLTEDQKQEIIDGTPLYLRDARAKGIPQLGAGAIYPILEEDVVVPDFELAPWFPRAYALDVGWNCTAAIWGAWDRESDIVYLYSAHKQGHAEPATHVNSIGARGDWIQGVIDPASKGRSQSDGKKLVDQYQDLGLDLSYANNAVEAGIFAVWQRLVSGRLKIFKSLTPWMNEFRIYRRDENGKVARDQDDHLMDCTRYLIMSGLNVASVPPYDEEEEYYNEHNAAAGSPANAGKGYYGIY